MPYSLLFVSSDKATAELVVPKLREEFRIDLCGSAQEALAQLRSRLYDLTLLESELPDMPGLTLFRIMRDTESGKKSPVVFISPQKTEASVAEAFGLGADDYLVSPCDPRELAARIRAVIRRKHEIVGEPGGALAISGIQIDPSQRRCAVNGKRVSLPPLEFELLKVLMYKAGRVLTRAYLLNNVWEMSGDIDTRAVDAAVSRLRRALGARAGKRIETVSKMGYCFRDPEEFLI